MVQIVTSGTAIEFQFTDSPFYLYGDGTMTFPLNSLLMVLDESDAVTFKNQAGDIILTTTLAELGKTKAEMQELYEEAFVGAEGISQEEVQELIDESISGLAVASAVTVEIEAAVSGKSDISSVTAVNDALTAHTASTDIHVTAEQKTAWDNKADVSAITAAVSGKVDTSALTANYYDKDDVDASFEVVAYSLIDLNETMSGKAATSAVTAEIEAAVSGKSDTSAVTAVNDALTGHTGDSTIHVTSSDKTNWNGAVTQLGGLSLVKCTQAEYDAMVAGGTVDPDTLYVIVN